MASDDFIVDRQSEALRQERETFNQLRRHNQWWFVLRLAMGFTSIPFLVGVAIFSCHILLDWQTFPSRIVTAAESALFATVLGVIVGVWKVVLAVNPNVELRPVTALPSSGASTR